MLYLEYHLAAELIRKMDDTLKVIKSLITASSDGGLLVKEINEEYKEMVGKPIPLQEFGFNTLADFLRSTNEFSGTKTPNGIKVTIKIPGKSAHIIAMRQQQNVSQAEKKRRKKALMKGGIGGAISSQQSKRPSSSQVMRRSSGTVMKQRPRVPPQRSVTFKPMPRPAMKPASQSMSNSNRPPMNTVTHRTMPSQTANLHDRFVQKKVSEPAIVPPTPTTSTTQFRCKSPQTPPPEGPSMRSKLAARLAAKQTTSDNCQKNSNDSGSHTSSVGRSSRSNLLALSARLTPKQSTPLTSNLIGRSALQKLYHNLEEQNKNCSSGNVNVDDDKQKLGGAVASGEAISRDLYARLSPKVNESANHAKTNGGDSLQTNIEPQANTPIRCTLRNLINKGNDLSSRLQPKQVDTVSYELQQINQQVRKIHA